MDGHFGHTKIKFLHRLFWWKWQKLDGKMIWKAIVFRISVKHFDKLMKMEGKMYIEN